MTTSPLTLRALRAAESHLAADLAQYAAEGDCAVDEVAEVLALVREAINKESKEC